jgi:bud site selection protein 31
LKKEINRIRSFKDIQMPKVRTKGAKVPDGFEVVEPVLQELETKMREGSMPSRTHHACSRTHSPLMFLSAAEVAPHEGKRKSESLWPIIRIHHQRSRYVYEMFYKKQEISREVYDYCLREGYADANLIAKWRKPGLDSLCCLGCAQTKDHNYGTACICRIPRAKLDAGRSVECATCGCRGCASGDDKFALIDVAATVEARGGLPPRPGHGGSSSSSAADAVAPPSNQRDRDDGDHQHHRPPPQQPQPFAAAAAAAAAGPPGFFPPMHPAMMQAMMAQMQQQMAAAAAAAASAGSGGAAAGPWPGLMMQPPLPPLAAAEATPPSVVGAADDKPAEEGTTVEGGPAPVE